MLFTFKSIKLLSCPFIFENNTVVKATFTGLFIKNGSEDSNFQKPSIRDLSTIQIKRF